MTDSPSLKLQAEMKPRLAELSRAFEAMAEAMRPAMKAVADMANRLMPLFDEKRRRRAKVKALRADFIRKRGMRR